jgi:dsRNA-specific ribonuclease
MQEGSVSGRLEFFGDKIVGHVIADYLFKNRPSSESEGLLTEYMSYLSGRQVMARACKDIAA